MLKKLLFIIALSLIVAGAAFSQTTGFTFQGKLNDTAAPANGAYDFTFRLFDNSAGGAQIGSDIVLNDVNVANGIFTVGLDFGAPAFANGLPRFLEIAVRNGPSTGAFTLLSPRQPVTSAPYAIKSLNAANADTSTNALSLGGTAANQFIQTTDSRLTDDRNPLPNSTNYIQNGTTQQASSNFNVSGTGTANIFNAATQFNIGGVRAFTQDAQQNTIAGNTAGSFLTTGDLNSFFGSQAGYHSTTGSRNAFFGYHAGFGNTTGFNNSFVGELSGNNSSTGSENSFYGFGTGYQNSTGSQNSFYGASAGFSNGAAANNNFFGYYAGRLNTADENNFFGSYAGGANTTGTQNSFFGHQTGGANTTGLSNSFFGYQAGFSNTTGGGNNFFGVQAGYFNTDGANNNFFGYRAGRKNTASQNNFFGSNAGSENTTGTRNNFFGYAAGSANLTGNDNSFFGSNAGSANTADANSFFGSNAGSSNTNGTFNSFFGFQAGISNTSGQKNTFVGVAAGFSNTTGVQNAFFGSYAGAANTTGLRNTFLGGTFPGYSNDTGDFNVFVGAYAGFPNTSGQENTFIGDSSGGNNTIGSYNTFVGRTAGLGILNGSSNSGIGYSTQFSPAVTNATAIGANASVTQNNSIVLGSISGVNSATANVNVGIGTTAPTSRFHVVGTGLQRITVSSDINAGLKLALGAQDRWSLATITGGSFVLFNEVAGQNALAVDGTTNTVSITTLGAAGATALCRNASNQIATCSSSLRYKTNINDFRPGLSLIKRLRPITFNWREGGMADLGLGAEDVAKVDELLVTRNEKGEVEGVKYDRVGVVLVNAVNEQQAEIEKQQRENEALKKQVAEQNETIKKQQASIEALENFVCTQKPRAPFCKNRPQRK